MTSSLNTPTTAKLPTRQTQIDLEVLYSKYQVLPVLREQFEELAKEYEDTTYHEFIEDVLSHIYLHRQADAVTMVGILSPKHGTPQTVADKLLEVVEMDYLDFNPDLGVSGMFVIRYDASEEAQAMLERYQYPLPMVRPPLPITNNGETGYETIKGSVILNGSSWFKEEDVCLDHLNRANAVALELDMDVIMSPEGQFIKPEKKADESISEFTKRSKQAWIFFTSSLEIMEGLNNLTDQLWLTYKYDRRGRCYASGYHVNTQGTDYHKAVLQFAKKELVL